MALAWPRFPRDKKAAQEFCARWIAVAFLLAAMAFFFVVLMENLLGTSEIRDTPRKLMARIFDLGPGLGGVIGAIPVLIAAAIALVYRNEEVDLIFYFAVFIVFATLICQIAILIQVIDDKNETFKAYFDNSSLSQFSPRDSSNCPIKDGIRNCELIQLKRLNQFSSNVGSTMGAILLWYCSLLAGLLGLKVDFENLFKSLFKTPTGDEG